MEKPGFLIPAGSQIVLWSCQAHGPGVCFSRIVSTRAGTVLKDDTAVFGEEESADTSMQNILLATDGSDGANRATDAAATLAKALGAQLSILTVGGNVPQEQLRQLAHTEKNIGDALDSLSSQILRQAEERSLRVGLSNVELRVGWGDPAEVIIATVQQRRFDAIVIGRRGRGRLAGLLLGSVSQKVVSLAPCIVIVVP